MFVIYAIIPGASISIATRGILQGTADAPFFIWLGVYNLSSGYLRWASDLADDAQFDGQPEPAFSNLRVWVSGFRTVLWIILVLDFFIEELLGYWCRMHSWRFLGPPVDTTDTTLTEYRTLAFLMGLISAAAQASLLDILKRRSVLLRLLGARATLASGLNLLLMGAFAVLYQSKTIDFLRESSPKPWWCCMVLWIRQYGAVVGFFLPIVSYVLLQSQLLSQVSKDGLVPIALIVGFAIGHLYCSSFNTIWQAKKEHLESDYRVIYLFPHMHAQARSKASDAMNAALRKGAAATLPVAVEWTAARMLRSFVSSTIKSLAG